MDMDGEVKTVAIQIDDGEWSVFSESEEWSYDLDTTELSNGEHTVRIKVTDDEGESYIETLTIDVDNPDAFPLWIVVAFVIIVILIVIAIAFLMGRKPA